MAFRRSPNHCIHRTGSIGDTGNQQHEAPSPNQQETVSRPILPHKGMAAGHQHCAVRFLLWSAEQLSCHIQQREIRCDGWHRHLFHAPLGGIVPVAIARGQSSAKRLYNPQYRPWHVAIPAGVHPVCRHAIPVRLLHLSHTYRSGQRPYVSRIPEYVYQCGPSQ